jgi:DNA-binding XRE family transcriptional regulator
MLAALAEQVGCSIQTIRLSESGKRHPSQEIAVGLTKALHSSGKATSTSLPKVIDADLQLSPHHMMDLPAQRVKMTYCEYLCPCDYYGDMEKPSTCTMAMIKAMINKYQKRISGPILDRIDIHLDVPRVPVQKLASLDGGEASSSIHQRAEAALCIQHARFTSLNNSCRTKLSPLDAPSNLCNQWGC